MATTKQPTEIDARVMDSIWGNVEELKSEIRAEANKASIILGYLGTFFFVISSKLSTLDTTTVKFTLVATFFVSLFLASYVIFSGKLYQLQVADFKNKTWDREVIFARLQDIYQKLQHILKRKSMCNACNIIFVFLVSLVFLVAII